MKAKQKKTGNFIIGFSAAFWRLILCCMIVCMRIERKENFMKIKSLPEEERPVEKAILAGAQCLSNAELLAVILGSGTKEKSAIGLAEEVLAQGSGGLAELADCTAQELTKIHGVGQFKAARILASVELGKRIANQTSPKAGVCGRCGSGSRTLYGRHALQQTGNIQSAAFKCERRNHFDRNRFCR